MAHCRAKVDLGKQPPLINYTPILQEEIHRMGCLLGPE
jgi:hypothetical protein